MTKDTKNLAPISERLKEKINEIMIIWEERVLLEIKAANHQGTLALRDSIPEYLIQLSSVLSTTVERTRAREKMDHEESIRLGKKHGQERAESINYTMDQMILEYHILRQVIFDVLEEDVAIEAIPREVIICSIEQAVNDAATQFSETLKDLQDQLYHTLAHDIRNPMSVAKVSAQLILRKPENTKSSIDSAERICRSMDRIDKMISDLLDASRMRAGESPPMELKECDLDWVIRDVEYELNIAHEGSFFVISEGPCIGVWNADGLRRLLENLYTNAIKYGENSTPITISLTQDDKFAMLKVHNKGNPIPDDIKQTLFDKFKRARSSENKVGWGLGLAVVKAMVDIHSGSIKVDSDPFQGTTFTITLPK